MELLNLSAVVKMKYLKNMGGAIDSLAPPSLAITRPSATSAGGTSSQGSWPSTPTVHNSSMAASASTTASTSLTTSTCTPPDSPFCSYLATTTSAFTASMPDAGSDVNSPFLTMDTNKFFPRPPNTITADEKVVGALERRKALKQSPPSAPIGSIFSTGSERLDGHMGLGTVKTDAEDALARALYLISELRLSDDERLPKVQSVEAAVTEAVPLVSGLQNEVEELRSQLAEYGRMMAERDGTLEQLRADLADLEEARSLYRQHVAHFINSTAALTSATTTKCTSADMLPSSPSEPLPYSSNCGFFESQLLCRMPSLPEHSDGLEKIKSSSSPSLSIVEATGTDGDESEASSSDPCGRCSLVGQKLPSLRAASHRHLKPPRPSLKSQSCRQLLPPRPPTPSSIPPLVSSSNGSTPVSVGPAGQFGPVVTSQPQLAIRPSLPNRIDALVRAQTASSAFDSPTAAAAAAAAAPSNAQQGSGSSRRSSAWEEYGISAAASALVAAASEVKKLWPASDVTRGGSATADGADGSAPCRRDWKCSSGFGGSSATNAAATANGSDSIKRSSSVSAPLESSKVAAFLARRHSFKWRNRMAYNGTCNGVGAASEAGGASRSIGAAAATAGAAATPASDHSAVTLSSQDGEEEDFQGLSFIWMKAEELDSVHAWEAVMAMRM